MSGGARHIEFFVPGPPQTKLRHRTSIRSGHVHTWNPGRNREAERAIVVRARQALYHAELPPRFCKAHKMKLVAYFGTKKEGRHGTPHQFRPDIDNIAKLYKDALNRFVYKDDCQVAVLEAAKLWVPECQQGVKIRIEEIDL